MMCRIIVVNSSPLIIFQRIGQLSLLTALFERVHVPPAVRNEVYGEEALPEWIEERSLAQPLASQIVAARLGPGEREAIALALELKATEIVLDDLAARRLAQSLRLPVIGSIGLLLRAKERGLVSAVRPLMERMQDEGFHIAGRVLAHILVAAGEG